MPALIVFVFLLGVLCWPLLLPDTNYAVAAIIGMFIVLIFTDHYNGSGMITFRSGLTTIVRLVRRQARRLWPVLVFPALLAAFAAASLFTVVGLVRGRETAQLLWIALVGKFARGRNL